MLLPFAAIALATASTSFAAITSLDSSLHRSFWGIAYARVILPDCGITQEQVTEDVLLLSQLTPRVRLYASDCGQVDMILNAINSTNADLTVWFGIYLSSGTDIDTVYNRQMKYITDALDKWGTKHFGGITTGNEFILDAYGDNGSADDANGVKARSTVLEYVKKTNDSLAALNLDKTIPVGTSDAGAAATETLCAGVDYYMANVHPWFGSVAVDQASAWTFNFFKNFDVDVCAKASNNPNVYIAETGWPTESMDTANAENGANSPASVAGLQTFIDDFVCSANSNDTDYFFFEMKDEKWKETYGGVEPYWGLFNGNRTLKAGLTIPTCEVTSPTGGTVSQLVFQGGSSSDGDSNSSSSSSSSDNTQSAAGPVVAVGSKWGALVLVSSLMAASLAVLA